ncbi:MAG: hypothetical protein ACK53K_07870 [Burkholderiales bacterium]|jgi:transcriptional regulator with XRE-family HTH domain
MNTVFCLHEDTSPSTARRTQAPSAIPVEESREERVSRLYASPGGPLIGWLFDECRRRSQEYRQMAACLGVTYGYINQLRSGLRQARHISDDFAVSCAHYLGVPPVIVKMVAGRIPMSDFVTPRESEEDALDRAMAQMLDDPVARRTLPADMRELSLSAKRALVAMYVESSGRDVLGIQQLPEMVRWLQRAVTIHDESEAEVMRGHRDIAD